MTIHIFMLLIHSETDAECSFAVLFFQHYLLRRKYSKRRSNMRDEEKIEKDTLHAGKLQVKQYNLYYFFLGGRKKFLLFLRHFLFNWPGRLKNQWIPWYHLLFLSFLCVCVSVLSVSLLSSFPSITFSSFEIKKKENGTKRIKGQNTMKESWEEKKFFSSFLGEKNREDLVSQWVVQFFLFFLLRKKHHLFHVLSSLLPDLNLMPFPSWKTEEGKKNERILTFKPWSLLPLLPFPVEQEEKMKEETRSALEPASSCCSEGVGNKSQGGFHGEY